MKAINIFDILSDKNDNKKIDIVNAYARAIKYDDCVIRRVNVADNETLDLVYLDSEFMQTDHNVYCIDALDDILYGFIMSLENDADALEVLSDLLED